ncbi:hypothetical protein IBTHAUMO2_390008 [Nitrosopumilaceae archaeon]|nr:hypothetical protein [Nitrosopumilus sp.]CAI9831739.1 hypothetical protein IBTHAUMO2_390008 [Nitrosopumilaceae archaeon]MDA7944776.1 hypothetical protein [Nitrosopumilus sp.]MDA7954652.1 hypothetical protein [Nitrosopumilus sp.]MDA7973677.1 hypothetical protein [Nitrosopumilus sp.]
MAGPGSENYPRLPLGRIFDAPEARILDLLFCNEGLSYTRGEIAGITKVQEGRIDGYLRSLLEEGMIKTAGSGSGASYAANHNSKRAACLLEYVNETIRSNFEAASRHSRR